MRISAGRNNSEIYGGNKNNIMLSKIMKSRRSGRSFFPNAEQKINVVLRNRQQKCLSLGICLVIFCQWHSKIQTASKAQHTLVDKIANSCLETKFCDSSQTSCRCGRVTKSSRSRWIRSAHRHIYRKLDVQLLCATHGSVKPIEPLTSQSRND